MYPNKDLNIHSSAKVASIKIIFYSVKLLKYKDSFDKCLFYSYVVVLTVVITLSENLILD